MASYTCVLLASRAIRPSSHANSGRTNSDEEKHCSVRRDRRHRCSDAGALRGALPHIRRRIAEPNAARRDSLAPSAAQPALLTAARRRPPTSTLPRNPHSIRGTAVPHASRVPSLVRKPAPVLAAPLRWASIRNPSQKRECGVPPSMSQVPLIADRIAAVPKTSASCHGPDPCSAPS